MKETWKPVADYEGFYEVSDKGNVRRVPSYHCKNYRLLKPKLTHDGYYETALSKNGKYKYIRTHRLVAMAFCDKQEHANEVNHIDGNKRNNNANNLEWVTPSENQKHAYMTGLQKVSGGAISNRKPIECITLKIKANGLAEMQRALNDMGITASRRLNRMSVLANESKDGYFKYLGLDFRLIKKGGD